MYYVPMLYLVKPSPLLTPFDQNRPVIYRERAIKKVVVGDYESTKTECNKLLIYLYYCTVGITVLLI